MPHHLVPSLPLTTVAPSNGFQFGTHRKAGAMRRDVQLFSRDISIEERIRRDIYESRFE